MQRLLTLALVLLLLLIITIALLLPIDEWIPAERWGLALESAGLIGMLAFLVLGMFATSIGLPRQLLAFIGGLAYGTLLGLALSLAAALSGCLLTVAVSKHLLATWVIHRYPKVIEKMNKLLHHDLFFKVLVLRLQPLGTNLLTNLCVGFTQVSIPTFALASAVGYVPQMLVFVLLGSGIRVESRSQMMVSALLLVISLLLGWFLFRRHVGRHAL